jgi:hypothetical protein
LGHGVEKLSSDSACEELWHLFGCGLCSCRMKVLLDFLFLNLALNLPLCQERQEGIKRLGVCILGIKTREMMNELRFQG